jgi:hypothetical protein
VVSGAAQAKKKKRLTFFCTRQVFRCHSTPAGEKHVMNMNIKTFKYALYISLAYILIVGFLGFGIRDDYLLLTFPSWPIIINCFEGCGYLMVIALILNGIIIGAIVFFILHGYVSFYSSIKQSINDNQEK